MSYRPAGRSSTEYDFLLEGDWNSKRHLSSLQLTDQDGVEFFKQVLVRDDTAYLVEDDNGCQRESVINQNGMSAPLVDSLPFTWDDILMPYLQWDKVVYIGPERYLGRPAHKYVITNEDPAASISKVIVTLDEDYAVLLKSDVFNKDDTLAKRVRVSGFKQFGNEWMFSELVWEHRLSRDSVRLKVSGFQLVR